MAKTKSDRRHAFDEVLLQKHEETGTVSGGACLNRHISEVRKNCSCSHRWQAYEKAKEDSSLYNYPAYASLTRKSFLPGRQTFETPLHGLSGLFYRNKPNPGDWDLDGHSKKGIPNFLLSCVIPYFHNGHHIIPNGLLNGCILESAQNAASYTLYKLIRIGLLDAKYNLNYKINVVILPMAKTVANALSLPRHISGIESEPGVSAQYMSHSVYDTKVKVKLKEIIQDYAEALDDPDEDHEKPPNTLSKAKLEKLSKDLYKKLKKWGKMAGGMSLDSMPSSSF